MTCSHCQVIFPSPQAHSRDWVGSGAGEGPCQDLKLWGHNGGFSFYEKHCLLIQTPGTCSQQYPFEFQLWLTQLGGGSVAFFSGVRASDFPFFSKGEFRLRADLLGVPAYNQSWRL